MGGVGSWLRGVGRRPTGEGLLNLTGILILCGPFLYWDLSRALYLLTSLFALAYLIRQGIRLPREHWLYSLPILVFFGAAVVSWLANGMTDSGWNILTSRYALLLLAIPLVSLVFAHYGPRHDQWFKFQAASLVLGGIAFYEILILGHPRAEGDDNAAIFGFVAAMLTGVALAGFRLRGEAWNRIALYVLSVSGGGAAVLLSGTRGAWLAAGACLAITGHYMLERYSAVWRALVFGVVILALGVVAAAVPPIKSRIVDMVEIVSPYFDGSEEIAFSSVRYRIETWKAGWHIGSENPLAGVGPGGFRGALAGYVDENPDLDGLQHMRHAHNQYMQAFATMGLPGLLAFAGLLLAHLFLFARYLSGRFPEEVRGFALGGMLLVMTFAVLSMTGVPLDRKKQIVIYGFCSASLWGCLLGAVSQYRAARAPARPDQVSAER